MHLSRRERSFWQAAEGKPQVRKRTDLNGERKWRAVRLGVYPSSRCEMVRLLHPRFWSLVWLTCRAAVCI